MEATDPIIGLKIARSDVAFIHDVLMSCQFSGAQMLQASGIIAGLRPALKAEPEAPATEPDQSTTDVHHNPSPHPETMTRPRRPAKRKR